MADKILDIASLCKAYPPMKMRGRIKNASTGLTGSQIKQWTDEIYPQYAEGCGIAEAVAPLVRSGRASSDVINSASRKINDVWSHEVVDRLSSGDMTVSYGGKRTRKNRRKAKRSRKTRVKRKGKGKGKGKARKN
jgi:hypothetical protein